MQCLRAVHVLHFIYSFPPLSSGVPDMVVLEILSTSCSAINASPLIAGACYCFLFSLWRHHLDLHRSSKLFVSSNHIVSSSVGHIIILIYTGQVNFLFPPLCGLPVYSWDHQIKSRSKSKVLRFDNHQDLIVCSCSWSMQDGSSLHGLLMSYIPRPKCYKKSPTVQDTLWSIPGFISCAGVTLR